ncbi:ABC transporter permease [Senegalimassilia faecalis]|uniref:ABC transporter permease n=1 Tax=Senegalimassilia faecalis TaxID=2509433 RepID=A0A4Q2K079_9ACTN|nr:ABC transporter permease [Senegalimassilia faecalis]RXZ54815.1 ABC transporter permease [Senegalimassilia faecalis]
MKALFFHTVRMLVRQRDVLVWVIAFPLVLATLFHVMFANFDEYYRADSVSCAVVADENYHATRATFFREMLAQVSAEGDDQLLDVREVANADAARDLVLSGDAAAAITVDGEGLPSMNVSPLASDTLDQSIVRAVLDCYRQLYAEMKQVFLAQAGAADLQAPPTDAQLEAFAQTPGADQAVQAFMADAVGTQQVDVLRVASSGTVRYYYALMGFAALMSVTVAIHSVSAVRANTSAVGARRQVSGTSVTRQLAVSMAASFAVVFACLLLAFAYMRLVLGVEFGGRDGLAVVAIAACALMSVGFGAVLGALPGMPVAGKVGLATGITCLCALFAGLYGEPAMQLADQISQTAPWAALINPAAQAANAFYDLTYYDSLAPFFSTVGVLVAMAAVFFVAAALLMRGHNYERL